MGKIDFNYAQFEKALLTLGFTKKVNVTEGVAFRHLETGFLVLLPPGDAEDVVPPIYQEVAQRTIALRGIATESQFERALLLASGALTRRPRRSHLRPTQRVAQS